MTFLVINIPKAQSAIIFVNHSLPTLCIFKICIKFVLNNSHEFCYLNKDTLFYFTIVCFKMYHNCTTKVENPIKIKNITFCIVKIQSTVPNSLNTNFQYSFVCLINEFLVTVLNILFEMSGTFGFLF